MAFDKEDKAKIIVSLIISSGFILLLFLTKYLETLLELDLTKYGIFPRTTDGLIGIITAPLIHADMSHLISNVLTLFTVFFGMLYFYRTSAFKVFIIVYLFSGLLVWLFARPAYHIGASGVLYGFVSFLFFSGMFRRDRRSIALSLLVVFLYGGMIWGVLPIQREVSFEAHLFGAITGLVCAFIYRKTDPPPKEETEEEFNDPYEGTDEDIDPDDVEIRDDARPKYF